MKTKNPMQRVNKTPFMKYKIWFIALVIASASSFLISYADEQLQKPQPSSISAPATVDEARARAKLLHETIHGTLQVVHRDFFDEDNASMIPSASLEDVFHELSRSYGIDLKWLVVNADVVNVDHEAEDEFERNAVKALAAGKGQFEATENGRYRYAGPIRLASQCLKCHVKNRTTTEDRTAGLLISMPLKQTTGDEDASPPQAD